jgi:hypothetical protein
VRATESFYRHGMLAGPMSLGRLQSITCLGSIYIDALIYHVLSHYMAHRFAGLDVALAVDHHKVSHTTASLAIWQDKS